MDPKAFRKSSLSGLTNTTGVYALCDLNEVPIYVGQSTDGIRARVMRHLTSARSDIIANRQIDVWEIAYVWAWPVTSATEIRALESALFFDFDSNKALMNGQIPQKSELAVTIPQKEVVQVIQEQERLNRLDPAQRLPRQISQYLLLVDYIQNVKDSTHLKRALDAHFERLVSYHRDFLS